jgi:periplasmic protein TonB
MKAKKNPKYKLEKYSMVFFEIGLAFTLLAVYLVLESKSNRMISTDFSESRTVFIEEMEIPQTERVKEKLILPKLPPPPVSEIRIVTNDTELEDELNIETTEIDEDYQVDIQEDLSLNNIDQDEEEEEVYNFQIVESQAVFPGCESYNDKQSRFDCFQRKIVEHIRKNFEYPAIALELGVQGRVLVQFVIGKDGIIGDIKVVRGVNKALDLEAVRIVSLLPQMTPAEQRGRKVPVSFWVPITFKLQ